MTYEEIIQKIKNLEIQGAEAVAKKAVEAFGLKMKKTQNCHDLKKYLEELKSLRSTEPALRNALNYCFANLGQPDIIQKTVQHFEKAKEKIAEFGAKKIEDGMTVFTHCHSSTVMKIIKQAHDDGKKIKITNTETRPKFQGRITAQEMVECGIPVDHYVDSGGYHALKKADIFLFGCDAITSDGRIINKIGTKFLLKIANEFNIPSYSCTNSWKFDPETVFGAEEEIEERDPNEVWPDAPTGVKIHNPAFETVSPDNMTGLICELGVFKPEALVNQIRVEYPWMINL